MPVTISYGATCIYDMLPLDTFDVSMTCLDIFPVSSVVTEHRPGLVR